MTYLNRSTRRDGAQPAYQIVATRCGMNGQNGFAPTSAFAGLQNRIKHTLPYACRNLVFVYAGFRVSSAVESSMQVGAGYQAVSAVAVAGGSSYSVGNTIIPNVGTSQFAPTIMVQSAANGVATQLAVLEGGMFGLFPSYTCTQSTTSNLGSGCTLTLGCLPYVAGIHVGLEQVWNTQTAYSATNPTGVVKITRGATQVGNEANIMLPAGDFIMTDPYPAVFAAGTAIGSRVFSNGYNIYPGRILSGNDGSPALSEYAQYQDQTDRAWGGTYPTLITGYLNAGYQPLAILGQLDVPKPSFVFIGDSIGQGVASYAGAVAAADVFDTQANTGWIEKGANQQVAWANFCSSGDLITNYTTPAQNSRLRALQALRPSHVVDEMGINDFVNGVTYPNFLAEKTSFWSMLTSIGVKEIWCSTITPRTTSSDNWATLANQTVFSGSTVRTTYNTFLLGLSFPNVYGITKVLDIAAQVEAGGANAGKWLVGYTLDGTHPTTTASAACTTYTIPFFGAATL